MSKTFAAKVADAIIALLPASTTLTVEADPANWRGYILVEHVDGARTFFKPFPVNMDRRGRVNTDTLEAAVHNVTCGLRPKPYYTDKARDEYRKAYDAWTCCAAV